MECAEPVPATALCEQAIQPDGPDRLVHVASRWECPLGVRVVVGLSLTRTSALTLLAVFAVMQTGAGGLVGPVVLAALILVFSVQSILRARRLPKPPQWVERAIDEWPREGFRLRLIAKPRVAEFMRRLGDGPSEPMVFRIAGSLSTNRSRKAQQVLILCAGLATVLFIAAVALPPTWKSQLAFAIAWMLAAAAWTFCWPTYLRLTPGRLDLMQYGFLGSGKPLTETYDLRSSRVVVDTVRERVLLEPTDGRRDLICYGSIGDDLGFAKALLEAARSTRSTPPLPDDVLTG